MSKDFRSYEKEYSNLSFEHHQVYFRKKKVREILSQHKHDCLLEVGCGLDPAFLSIDTFKSLYIVEPAELFYKNAIEKAKSHARNADIVVVNKLIEESRPDLKGVPFDFVLLSGLLQDVPDPKPILKTIREMVAEDTVVHVNVSNALSFHRLLAYEMGLIKSVYSLSESNVKLQQTTVFDMQSLRQLVEDSGFSVLDSGSYFVKPFTHTQLENMLNSGYLNVRVLDGLYNMEKYMPGLGSEIFVNIRKSKSTEHIAQ